MAEEFLFFVVGRAIAARPARLHSVTVTATAVAATALSSTWQRQALSSMEQRGF